jgi:hypothetical protein
VKSFREQSMMVDMDHEEYMPPDSRIMEECPWTDFVDKSSGA